MRTVRLNHELESRLEETARLTGQTVSEIIREAVRKHCDALRRPSMRERMKYAIGSAQGGGDARRVKDELRQILTSKQSRRKRT